MNRLGMTLMFVVLLSVSMGLAAQEVPTSFSPSHYYILALGGVSMDLPSLAQATQSSGYSVVQFDGNVPDGDLEAALEAPSMLLIDAGRFYLRQIDSAYTFAVRPSDTGYELVVSPNEQLPITDVLGSILLSLQGIGILGNDVNLDYSAYSKADLKGPASPEGVYIDSTLYGLTVSEDWFDYATAHALTMVGLRIEVVAEILPGHALDSAFSPYMTEETSTLAKLLLPIDELLALATSESVGYVRTAYQPAVP
jgi:hypothetical protein